MACAGPAGGEGLVKSPFRVIYVEGWHYPDYYRTLEGLVRGLQTLGLVRPGELPEEPDAADTGSLWAWLSRLQGEGGGLVFPADGHYSAGRSGRGRAEVRREVLARIRERGDVDLILAFGTGAGLDFVAPDVPVPVMSLAATDPVGAGIVGEGGEGGEGGGGVEGGGGSRRPGAGAHVFVKRDRIPAQLAMFHRAFGFRRLGVPLALDLEGRLAMGWPAIERAARELGFETAPCRAGLEGPDREAAFRNLRGCLEDLAGRADAVYLTINPGMIRSRLGELLAPLAEAGLPTFSQEGADDVREGVLMSAGQDDYAEIGLFEARALAAIASGKPPGSVPQVYRAPATVALNLAMAQRIGWAPPFAMLVEADRLYQVMAEPAAPAGASGAKAGAGPQGPPGAAGLGRVREGG
jgi:hypothetical protein